MVLATSVLKKYRHTRQLLEIKKDEEELTAEVMTVLDKNGWRSKKTSNNSPNIDVVYMNRGNTAWVWYDMELKQWFYSDNPQGKSFDAIENTKIISLIKSMS